MRKTSCVSSWQNTCLWYHLRYKAWWCQCQQHRRKRFLRKKQQTLTSNPAMFFWHLASATLCLGNLLQCLWLYRLESSFMCTQLSPSKFYNMGCSYTSYCKLHILEYWHYFCTAIPSVLNSALPVPVENGFPRLHQLWGQTAIAQ